MAKRDPQEIAREMKASLRAGFDGETLLSRAARNKAEWYAERAISLAEMDDLKAARFALRQAKFYRALADALLGP